jgi:hypothetical protein
LRHTFSPRFPSPPSLSRLHIELGYKIFIIWFTV